MDKTKAKGALYRISNPEEKKDMEMFEMAELNKNYEVVLNAMERLEQEIAKTPKSAEMSTLFASLAQGFKSITDGVHAMKKGHSEQTVQMVTSLKELQDEFLKSLKGLKGVMENQDFNKNAGPLYKTMINAIAGVEKAVVEKPTPHWAWPQYASVGVRNKSFSNIDPAQNEIASSIGTGLKTVTTAGTAVQLSATSVPCVAVYITAHASNTNEVTVGDVNVVGALSGRRGYTLYPTNAQKFVVSNLNMLYIDSVTSGDKVHYYYEVA